MATLLIKHAVIITMAPDRRIIKDGAVMIEGDRISGVGKLADFGGVHVETELDARGRIVIPGLIDTHIHAVQWMSRGLIDDVRSLSDQTRRHHTYEACLTDDTAYLSATLYCAEMIRTGTTCVAEIGGYQPNAIATAFRDFGIRGVISWGGMDYFPPGFEVPDGHHGRLSTDETIAVNQDIVRRWHRAANGRIRASYGIRREVNASDHLYLRVKECADRDGTIIQAHASLREWVEEMIRRTGRSTIEHLENLGVLGPNWLLVHVVQTSDRELDILAKHGCKVSHNIGTSLHDGFGAVSMGKFPEMVERGITVSLGCDTVNDNNSLDMFRAMYLAATVHKEARLRRDLIPAEQALEMATIQGARALGWEDEIGSIEVGKKADLVMIDSHRLHWTPMHDFSIVRNLVYAGCGYDVILTMVDGQILFHEGRFTNRNVDQLAKDAQKEAEAILTRLPYTDSPRWPVI